MKLPPRVKDLTGVRFGSLVAVKLHTIKEPKNTAYWEYLCDCGKTHIARGNVITYHSKRSNNPVIPSCGCKELELKTKHGFRKSNDTHPLYQVYKNMRERCYTTTSKNYHNYGAKGVTICDEWLDNPKAFVEWGLSNGWQQGMHLDKDILSRQLGVYPPMYSPDTCKWVTPQVNVAEATSRHNYGNHPNIKLSQSQVNDIIHSYTTGQANGVELAKEYNVDPSSIYRILRKHKSDSKG